MANESIEQQTRKFWDGQIGRVVWLIMISMFVNAAFTALLMWKVTHPTEASYYVTTKDSHATLVTALDQPNQSDAAIIDWASQAAVTINTYNFLEWEAQISKNARSYFSEAGWEQFYVAFQNSANFRDVLNKKLRVSSVVNKKPTILRKGMLNGVYTWKVDVPIFETYESPGTSGVEKLVISLVIARISTGESRQGIGIIEYRSGSVGSIV